MQGHDQRRKLILNHVLQFVDEEDDRGFLFGRGLADGGQKLAEVIVEIAAVGETLPRFRSIPSWMSWYLTFRLETKPARALSALRPAALIASPRSSCMSEARSAGARSAGKDRPSGASMRTPTTPRASASRRMRFRRTSCRRRASHRKSGYVRRDARECDRAHRRLFDRRIAASQLRRRRARPRGVRIGPGVHL